MKTTVARIAQKASALSDAERDELILELFNQSYGVLSDEELLTEELKTELDRRLARLDSEPHSGVTPAEAVRIARERVRQRNQK